MQWEPNLRGFCVSRIRTASHFAGFASAEGPDRLTRLFERLLGCLGAQCDCFVGAILEEAEAAETGIDKDVRWITSKPGPSNDQGVRRF